jgi:hypothetical protein
MTIRAYRITLLALTITLLGAAAVLAATPMLNTFHGIAGAQLQRDTYTPTGLGASGSDGARVATGRLAPMTSTSPGEVSDAYVTVTSSAAISPDDVGQLQLYASINGVRRLLAPRYPYQGIRAIRRHRPIGRLTVNGAWRLSDLPASSLVAIEPQLVVQNQHPITDATGVTASLYGATVSIEYSRADG